MLHGGIRLLCLRLGGAASTSVDKNDARISIDEHALGGAWLELAEDDADALFFRIELILLWQAPAWDDFAGRAKMNISFITPRPELQPYVESLWAFESAVGLPSNDSSIVVPNGCPKLIIACENQILRVAAGRVYVTHEQRMIFLGNRDRSTLLRARPRRTAFIVIEFTPQGAFPIFGVPMSETFNECWEADAVFGKWSRETSERVNRLYSLPEKVACVQERLILLLRQHGRHNGVVDYCVNTLRLADGRIRIKDLERQTGYTWRYLDRLFQNFVGLAPKVLAAIFRFQRFYLKWANGESFDQLKDELYEHYYDQAHFIREFRRMTGHPPLEFIRDVRNEFGRRLLLR